jgi:3-dehydroquinate synthase
MHIKRHAVDIPVSIGSDVTHELVSYLSNNFSNHSIYIIADRNLTELHGGYLKQNLGTLANFGEVISFVFGESSKNRNQKAMIEDELLRKKAGRDTLIITFGGGVTGDLAGYVAATFNRGVPLVHIPTSLLAQVDSSIGGKVGVNTKYGKNLIGAFYQPAAIFIDVAFLKTLPKIEFENGMAEIIKYAVTLDDELMGWLENEHQAIRKSELGILQKIVTRSVEIKIKVVESDEHEKGFRSILNFGHTVGHAIENLSNYKLKHGFAVATGMKVASMLSHQLLDYPSDRYWRLRDLIGLYNLDTVNPQNFNLDDVWQTMILDKKTRQKHPRFTLLKNVNQPELFYPITKKELKNAFQAL